MITLLGNRYQVVRQIGAGGMGRVFQAVDTQTGRAVAAKVMIAGGDEDLNALLRFYQEGAVLSTLKHPNIVEVYGTFLEEGSCSIIMELLEGSSLADVLRVERLTLARVKLFGEQVAAALSYAHQRSIIHRDVKPSNVMVVSGERVKVTDFGIARVAQGGTLRTASGLSLGTPLYMSPEQIEGGMVDARSDIYSLGAMLYEMVAGRPPFEGSDPLSIAFKHVHKVPPKPSEFNRDVPKDWERLILTMLVKDPARRVQTAAEVAEVLSQLNEDDGGGRKTDLFSARTLIAPMVQAEGAERTQPRIETDSGGTVVAEPQPPVQPVKGRRTVWPYLAGVAALAVLLVAGLVAYNMLNRGTHPKSIAFLRQLGPFTEPQGGAVDGQANIYIAAWGQNQIIKLSSDGRVLKRFGSQGSGSGQLNGPSGVALDAKGNIYVADSSNNRIVKLKPDGSVAETWGGPNAGSGRGQFSGVHGLAVDENGTVYAADYNNNRIVKLNPDGSVADMWGGTGKGTNGAGSGPGQFSQPLGVALDSSGNVYVADFDNSRVEELTPNGQFVKQFTGFGSPTGFVRPHGVAVDKEGNIYVADFQNDMVEEIAPDGTPLHRLGKSGAGHGQFNQPAAVWVDGQGNIYVADSKNDRVQEFTPAG